MKLPKFVSVGSMALSLLAGCGGGGDSPPVGVSDSASTGSASGSSAPSTAAATLEGFYAGPLAGTTTTRMMVLENNETHFLVGTSDAGGGFVPTGWSYGTSQTNGRTFTSTFQDSTLSGNFDGVNVSGTLVLKSSGQAVSLSLSKSVVAGYSYNQPAQLANIVGTWQATTGTVGSQFTVSPGGTFSVPAGTGCTLTFALTPRPSGRNVFNVTITGVGTCAIIDPVSGLAVPYTDGTNHQRLVILAHYGGSGFIVAGQR